MATTPQDVLKAIKARQFAPLYFLQGEEPYFIDAITDLIERTAIAEHERGFNQVVMYGKDQDMARILTQAKRYPMMAERQVVIVKEAQEIPNLNQAMGQQLLEAYAKQPLPSTILVFAHKNKVLDGRKNLAKVLEKQAVLVLSEKIKDNKLPDWIMGYARDNGMSLAPDAVQALAEAIGTDLSRMANELDKLSLNVSAGESITAPMVERFVGFSREYTVWELQRTLAARNLSKSIKIIRFFAADAKAHPIIPTISVLFSFFSKVLVAHASPDKTEAGLARILGVSPYQAKDYVAAMRTFQPTHLHYIIEQIRLADCRSKGIDSGLMSDLAIMEELVAAIIGV